MKAKLILIGVLSSIVLAGLWYFFLWKPAGENLESARAERAAAETEAQRLQVRLSHLKKLEANADVLERDRQLFAQAMPDSDRLDEFIHQVNERAARAGVGFVSVSPSPPDLDAAAAAAAAGPKSIALTMQVDGTYFQVLRFLEELRDGPRLVTVENFAMSRPADDKPASATVSGRMFMNPAPATPAAATTGSS